MTEAAAAPLPDDLAMIDLILEHYATLDRVLLERERVEGPGQHSDLYRKVAAFTVGEATTGEIVDALRRSLKPGHTYRLTCKMTRIGLRHQRVRFRVEAA